MRVKNLGTVAVSTAATSVYSTVVDLSAEPVLQPFAPGASAVAVLDLVAVANTTVTLQGSVDGGNTYATLNDGAGNNVSVTVTTAVTRAYRFNVKSIAEKVRIASTTPSTTGAGTVNGDLLQN